MKLSVAKGIKCIMRVVLIFLIIMRRLRKECSFLQANMNFIT